MSKEYEVFVRDLSDLKEGKEVRLVIRDLTPGPRKYDARIVKAVVSSSPDKLPGGDTLRVRSGTGVLYPKPWGMKILERLEDYIPGPPYGEII